MRVDSAYSSYRERLTEHLFVGEILRVLWLAGVSQVEVLKPETDGAGYDVVLECRSVVRHIQLKAARRGGKRASVGVQVKLGEKPSGCVVWIYFDPATMELGPYFWFGTPLGEPMPDISTLKVARHTKRRTRQAAKQNVRPCASSQGVVSSG